jgi:hypothetical protein
MFSPVGIINILAGELLHACVVLSADYLATTISCSVSAAIWVGSAAGDKQLEVICHDASDLTG